MALNDVQRSAKSQRETDGTSEHNARSFHFSPQAASGFSFSNPNNTFSNFARSGGADGAGNEDLFDTLDRMQRDGPQHRDFASVAAAANPSDCSFYVHYTLSEDRTGTQEEVMSRRLAPLAEKSRNNAFMDHSEVRSDSEDDTSLATLSVARKQFDQHGIIPTSPVTSRRTRYRTPSPNLQQEVSNTLQNPGQGLQGIVSSYSGGDLGGMASTAMGLFKKATDQSAYERSALSEQNPMVPDYIRIRQKMLETSQAVTNSDVTNSNKRIWVGDLSPEVHDLDLDDAFSPFGPISSAFVSRQDDTLPSRFAFVTFYYREHAEKALRSMNGRSLKGRIVRCNWANPYHGPGLTDHQMQMLLLEQQNKKRLMMARQEVPVLGRTRKTPVSVTEAFNTPADAGVNLMPLPADPLPPSPRPLHTDMNRVNNLLGDVGKSPEPNRKSAATFYVKMNGHSNKGYQRVSLSRRTVSGLLDAFADHFVLDPTRIHMIRRVIAGNVEVIVDNDSVREIPEGQAMIASLTKVKVGATSSSLLWEMELEWSSLPGAHFTGLPDGWELRRGALPTSATSESKWAVPQTTDSGIVEDYMAQGIGEHRRGDIPPSGEPEVGVDTLMAQEIRIPSFGLGAERQALQQLLKSERDAWK
jgi:RNA recognition motif-containing protein